MKTSPIPGTGYIPFARIYQKWLTRCCKIILDSGNKNFKCPNGYWISPDFNAVLGVVVLRIVEYHPYPKRASWMMLYSDYQKISGRN